jgi:hypothetical protein
LAGKAKFNRVDAKKIRAETDILNLLDLKGG